MRGSFKIYDQAGSSWLVRIKNRETMLITLTDLNGEPVNLSLTKITDVKPDENGGSIVFVEDQAGGLVVKETMDEIMELMKSAS